MIDCCGPTKQQIELNEILTKKNILLRGELRTEAFRILQYKEDIKMQEKCNKLVASALRSAVHERDQLKKENAQLKLHVRQYKNDWDRLVCRRSEELAELWALKKKIKKLDEKYVKCCEEVVKAAFLYCNESMPEGTFPPYKRLYKSTRDWFNDYGI